MELKVVREPATLPKNNQVEISEAIVNAISQTVQTEWDAYFDSLRLNVQSRILGSQASDLIKLQARVEQIEEERVLFKKLFTGKLARPGFS